jgi:hypothetical protein
MNKYVVALLLGFLTGVAMFLCLLVFNPFMTQTRVSPLSFSDNELVTLQYSAVAQESLVYTNDGESQVDPYPPGVLELWEAPVRNTAVRAVVLTGAADRPRAIGVKFSSDSETTEVLKGHAHVDSVWHIYLPDRGGLFIQQAENFWDYLREVVVPAYWSAGDSWRGVWMGTITAGPNALGTARVVGGSGDLAELQAEAVESLSAHAYSVEQGPVSLRGELTIELTSTEFVPIPDP